VALPPHSLHVLLDSSAISAKVRDLGEAIARDYPDPEHPLLLIGVLNGAAIFLADLVRAIPRTVEYDFVQFRSYGDATESSGVVETLKNYSLSVAGKHVIVVEDILDTGLTLGGSRLLEQLLQEGARSVRVCVLIDKPARRKVPVEVHYRGFEIPDQFVVGYGLDYAQQYRNLPYVALVSHCETAER
jgi:hypoxanthine phosphoribosyltransferase